MKTLFRQGRIFVALSLALTTLSANAFTQKDVDDIIKPLMEQKQIPGMSVAISVEGKHYIYHYGVQSKQSLVLMNPLMILVKIIKLRWIHILSYDQM
ncbi:hypothetical protein AB7321_20235, partial [Providencia rettgeri]